MKQLQLITVIIIVYFLLKILLNHLGLSVLFQPIKANMHYNIDINKHQQRLRFKLGDSVTLTELNIPTQDGEMLKGYCLNNPTQSNCYIFSHGNAGNIYDRIHMLYTLGQIGSVIIYDYRGYGMSTGSPSESGVFRDVLDTWNYATDELNFDKNTIVFIGESLGASISSWIGSYLAMKDSSYHPAKLIMVAGFSSLKDIVQDLHGSYISHFTDNEFASKQYLEKIGTKFPVLILHSQDDELIPYKHHKELLKFNSAAIHYSIKGAHGSPEYSIDILNLIKS